LGISPTALEEIKAAPKQRKKGDIDLEKAGLIYTNRQKYPQTLRLLISPPKPQDNTSPYYTLLKTLLPPTDRPISMEQPT
jgi:hypothetical protein